MVLRILIHDPRHDLAVGIHVWRGDIDVGPDHFVDLVGELSRHALELARIEGAGVDPDSPLGATVGNADHGGLPGHQTGEGVDFVLVRLLVVTEAPLEGTPGRVVLDAEALEDAHRAIVHLDGDRDLELARRGHQQALDALADVHDSRGAGEVAKGVVERHADPPVRPPRRRPGPRCECPSLYARQPPAQAARDRPHQDQARYRLGIGCLAFAAESGRGDGTYKDGRR